MSDYREIHRRQQEELQRQLNTNKMGEELLKKSKEKSDRFVDYCKKCERPTVHKPQKNQTKMCMECKAVFKDKTLPLSKPVNEKTMVKEEDLAVGLTFSSPLSLMDVVIIGFAGDDVFYRMKDFDYRYSDYSKVSKKKFVMWCNGDTEHTRR